MIGESIYLDSIRRCQKESERMPRHAPEAYCRGTVHHPNTPLISSHILSSHPQGYGDNHVMCRAHTICSFAPRRLPRKCLRPEAGGTTSTAKTFSRQGRVVFRWVAGTQAERSLCHCRKTLFFLSEVPISRNANTMAAIAASATARTVFTPAASSCTTAVTFHQPATKVRPYLHVSNGCVAMGPASKGCLVCDRQDATQPSRDEPRQVEPHVSRNSMWYIKCS